MSEELKPCPFCGGESQIENDGASHDVIGCCDPDCIGSEVGCHYLRDDISLRNELISQWNTRSLTPAQQHADEMYEMLDQICVSMHKTDAGTIEDILAIEALLARARGEQ